MDNSISGGSRSRTDQSMNDLARNSRAVRKSLATNGGFATERAWIDRRLSYRRIVYRMIKDIESHCDDVVCLSQNFLKLTQEQFNDICNQDKIDMIVSQTETELQSKQTTLGRDISSMAADSDSDGEGVSDIVDYVDGDSSSNAAVSDNGGLSTQYT